MFNRRLTKGAKDFFSGIVFALTIAGFIVLVISLVDWRLYIFVPIFAIGGLIAGYFLLTEERPAKRNLEGFVSREEVCRKIDKTFKGDD